MFGRLLSFAGGSGNVRRSSGQDQYQKDMKALQSLGISGDRIRLIFTEYARCKNGGGIRLERPQTTRNRGGTDEDEAAPSSTDSAPTPTYDSLVDFAIHVISQKLTHEIRPKMKLSAYEDTFVVLFESWIKKQARRSKINWKKRVLKLRTHGPTFVLSYYKHQDEGDHYIQQVPMALGVRIRADFDSRTIECSLDNGDEHQILLRFKTKTNPLCP